MGIYNSVSDLIGNTPLIRVKNFCLKNDIHADLLIKAECFNPAGSAKDRVAKAMLDDAEEKGIIGPGSVIIEPTSGNTGIGLASYAASKGYRVILTMPETMSAERRLLLKAYGAEIVLTKGELGMSGAIKEANRLSEEIPGSFIPGQFENPSNPWVHFTTTGPEIWEDTEGKIDIFVAGVGTGGTLSGVGKYLKSKNPDIKVVAVEPEDSPLISKGISGPHKIQGIGANFIPENLDMNVFDQVVSVSSEDAFSSGRQLAEYEGLLVGISSGAALFAAAQIARLPENEGKTIVALLPDTGERYLSTSMFNQ